jgi:hypothetical protein
MDLGELWSKERGLSHEKNVINLPAYAGGNPDRCHADDEKEISTPRHPQSDAYVEQHLGSADALFESNAARGELADATNDALMAGGCSGVTPLNEE